MLLSSERLELRPLEEGDLDALRLVLGDPWTMRFYPAPFDDDAVAAWISRNAGLARDGLGLHAVVIPGDEVIGDCGPVPQTLPDGRVEIELGWHIRSDMQGRGYATEAGRTWIEELSARGAPGVISLVRPENVPSCRVAEKLGMRVAEQILWNAELRWPHNVYRLDLPAGSPA